MAEDKAKKTVAKEDAPKKAAPKAETKKVEKKAAAPKKAEAKTTEKKETAKAEVKKAAPKKEAAKAETKKAALKAEAKAEVAKEKPAKKVEKEHKVERYVHEVKKSTNRVVRQYEDVAIKALMEKFNYTSVMQVPKLSKIVINMGVGDATQNAKLLEDAVRELTVIAGQKPVVTIAKKSEASFKLRAGTAIGCKVDLRGERMYDFFEKLISIALPRVRDFRGVSKDSFDGHGNYTLGVREQLIFAEIDFDLVNKVRGMDIVIVTTAKTDAEAYELLKLLGMPFRR
jgi:large subunit ribosomal protein L5